MQSPLSTEILQLLRRVADAAKRELNHGAGCREVNRPLTVTNLGLARRFESMPDPVLLRHLRHEDADVPFLVFYGLHDVLTNEDGRLRSLTAELLRDARPALGRATAAALRAVEHYDRDRLAGQRDHAHRNRITQYLQD